jgi:purine-binding chemotaxis protein CheW
MDENKKIKYLGNENDKELKDFILFHLEGAIYGIELKKIKEILTYPHDMITRLPNVNKCVKGLLNLRGNVIPIIDFRIKFIQKDNPIYDDKTAIITISTNDFREIGIVIDKVEDTIKLDETQIVKAEDLGTSIKKEFLIGYIQNEDNRMIIILDIEKILSKDEINKL